MSRPRHRTNYWLWAIIGSWFVEVFHTITHPSEENSEVVLFSLFAGIIWLIIVIFAFTTPEILGAS